MWPRPSGVCISGTGTTLLLEPGRELDAADLQAILDAARPLLAVLRERGLGRATGGPGPDPTRPGAALGLKAHLHFEGSTHDLLAAAADRRRAGDGRGGWGRGDHHRARQPAARGDRRGRDPHRARGPGRAHPDVREPVRPAAGGELHLPAAGQGGRDRVPHGGRGAGGRGRAQGARPGQGRLRQRGPGGPEGVDRRGGAPGRVHHAGREPAPGRAGHGPAGHDRPAALGRGRGHLPVPAGGGAPLHPGGAAGGRAGRVGHRARHRRGPRRLQDHPAGAAARLPEPGRPVDQGPDRPGRSRARSGPVQPAHGRGGGAGRHQDGQGRAGGAGQPRLRAPAPDRLGRRCRRR